MFLTQLFWNFNLMSREQFWVLTRLKFTESLSFRGDNDLKKKQIKQISKIQCFLENIIWKIRF